MADHTRCTHGSQPLNRVACAPDSFVNCRAVRSECLRQNSALSAYNFRADISPSRADSPFRIGLCLFKRIPPAATSHFPAHSRNFYRQRTRNDSCRQSVSASRQCSRVFPSAFQSSTNCRPRRSLYPARYPRKCRQYRLNVHRLYRYYQGSSPQFTVTPRKVFCLYASNTKVQIPSSSAELTTLNNLSQCHSSEYTFTRSPFRGNLSPLPL